jgi:N-acyl-phosphatidylethanolamine-hydrolysing phospholipase D
MRDHHTASGFRNLHSKRLRGRGALLRWVLGLGPEEPRAVASEKVPRYRASYAEPDRALIDTPPASAVTVTWIGHATFLIQVPGLNLLTDPVFSERCSPVGFAGPRRLARPGLALGELPRIDGVLISHNHYDHLDRASVRALAGAHFFVPLGLKRWFRRNGITAVTEMDWWQRYSCHGQRLHCVPAQHFSGRGVHDHNRSLWAGWVVETNLGNVYFAGDTGYAPIFERIGERLGPMRLALIPIGSYRPRWFLGDRHVDAAEAVRIHREVRARRSIGMHWGTFQLSREPLAEPPLYLAQARAVAGLGAADFGVLGIGETVRV